MIRRKALIIHFEDEQVLTKLDRRFISIYYVSAKEKYAYIYFDYEREKQVLEQLKRHRSITEIEPSLFDCENIIINN